LSRSEYVGADASVIGNSMTGTFEFEQGDKRPAPDFNVFFRYNATFPYYSDAVWTLTQMRRWGQISEAQSDSWYDETAKSVYKPAIYQAAAEALIAEGLASADMFDFDADGYREPTADFLDSIPYDGKSPNAYIDSLTIGLKADQQVVGGAVSN
jgi:nitrate/nitrite transport system substrate-binding protein